MTVTIRDLIVIGGGPAGITAAIYAARKAVDFLVLTVDIGGQTAWSGNIENYTGFQFITGPELADKFDEHIRAFNVETRVGEEVTGVSRENDSFTVETDADTYRARAVIAATGRIPRKLDVPGEDEFRNRGVAYCATCDGPVFADQEVAIIGGGNSALDACLQMIRIARKVYLIQNLDHLTGDPVMIEKVRSSPIIEIITGARVTGISGEELVTGISFKRKDTEEKIKIGGVFIEIGSRPASGPFPDAEKNESGEIVVDCACRTGIPGLYAAGDVTNVPGKQIIVAAGEGAKAALAAFHYLSTQK